MGIEQHGWYGIEWKQRAGHGAIRQGPNNVENLALRVGHVAATWFRAWMDGWMHGNLGKATQGETALWLRKRSVSACAKGRVRVLLFSSRRATTHHFPLFCLI